MLRQLPDLTVNLLEPERKLSTVCKIFRLVDETRAQTAGIYFLQADNIVRLDHRRNTVQIELPFTVWKHMLPSLGQVVAILARIDSCLDVVAEQSQSLIVILFHCGNSPTPKTGYTIY